MKISATEIQKVDKLNKTSFQGLKRTYDKDQQDVYRFYVPPYDKSKYTALLQLCVLKPDGKGGFEVDTELTEPFTYDNSFKEIREHGFTDYPRDIIICDPKEYEYIGYRFRLVDKLEANKAFNKIDLESDISPFDDLKTQAYRYDPGSVVEDPKYGKFTVLSNNMGMTPKTGPALHIFYDAYDSAPNIDRKSFVRNHFNKAGGDIDGILKYKDEIEPYRYIMTNPYMGRDTKSSHKYWGEEFFQMPSVSKFKDTVVGLFREGKGYIADGAITSQSIQSPLFQNVLKYGKNSPYYHWFKINGRIKLGVFPDEVSALNPNRPKVMEHVGYKIINPLGTKDYDPKKPSYIQFFDDRLASREQQRDTKNFIESYANPNPKDHYDITTHQDSILPYFFEIDYSDKEVRKKFSGYTHKMLTDADPRNSGTTILQNLDSFFSFENFDIVRKGRSGGANFWDGNVDLVKMNLANPNSSAGDLEGYDQAREYLYSVAKYWTQFTHDAIYEDLAGYFSRGDINGIKEIAKANDLSAEDIEAVLNYSYQEKLDSNTAAATVRQTVEKCIDDFRYETLDVSPSLAAITNNPQFKKYMQNPEVKNRIFYYVIETLRKLDACSTQNIIEPSSEITDLLSLEQNGYDVVDNAVKFTDFGKSFAELYTPKIIGYAVLKAMFPQDKIQIDSKGMLTVSDDVKKRSAREAGVLSTKDPQDEAKQLAKRISKNLARTEYTEGQQQQLTDQLVDLDVMKYTPKSFKQAELLLKKSGGGLNWRFDAAKDIGDLTSNRNGLTTFEQSWDDVCEFWGEFVSRVREINPSAYVVAEVTDLWSFYNNTPLYRKEARQILGPDASESAVSDLEEKIRKEDWGKYTDPNVAERMLYEKTGATTGSNYSTFFGLVPNLFGQNFEFGDVTGEYANMDAFKHKMQEYLKSGPMLYLTHSHVFVDNHDKPRALHCLALDMGAYLSRFGINSSSKTNQKDIEHAKEACDRVLGKGDKNYDAISSKAIVVADKFKSTFEKVLVDDKESLKIINRAIADLAVGKFKRKTDTDFLRAESFGQNPFDISLKDILDQAQYIASKEGKSWLSDRQIKDLNDAVYREMMAPALSKMIGISDVLNSITGIPFFYAGTNLGQTGYEYASKNISVANRNLIRHEWIDPNSDEFKPEIKEYYDRMQARANLYKEYGLSAIADGTPISLPQPENKGIYALLKYDDKGSSVIQVFSNVGMTSDYNEPLNKDKESVEVKAISLKGEDGAEYDFHTPGAKKDIVIKRKVYDRNSGKFRDEVDSNGYPIRYTVVGDSLVRADGKPIKLNETVSTFYKPTGLGKVSHDRIMMSRFFEN